MLSRTYTGKLGEAVAQKYYQNKGFKLVARNFRYKQYELDLILEGDNKLCFVEVKTRRFADYTQKELISNKKLMSLKTAIYLYLRSSCTPAFKSWELELFALTIEANSKPRLTVLPILQGFG